MLIKFMVIMKQILVFRRFHNIAKSDYQLRRVCLSVRPSVQNKSSLIGRIFVKFYI